MLDPLRDNPRFPTPPPPPELSGVGRFAGFQKPLSADIRNWLILQPTRAAFRGFNKHLFLVPLRVDLPVGGEFSLTSYLQGRSA